MKFKYSVTGQEFEDWELDEMASILREARPGPVKHVLTVEERQKGGQRGGAKGGVARAAALSPARRREIAQQAAHKMWSKKRTA